MKKLAYIATPYKAVIDACPKHYPFIRALEAINIIASKACNYVRKNMEYIPISPVKTFANVYDENNPDIGSDERQKALTACFFVHQKFFIISSDIF